MSPYTFVTAATSWRIDFGEILLKCASTCDYNVVTHDSDVVTHAFDVVACGI